MSSKDNADMGPIIFLEDEPVRQPWSVSFTMNIDAPDFARESIQDCFDHPVRCQIIIIPYASVREPKVDAHGSSL